MNYLQQCEKNSRKIFAIPTNPLENKPVTGYITIAEEISWFIINHTHEDLVPIDLENFKNLLLLNFYIHIVENAILH